MAEEMGSKPSSNIHGMGIKLEQLPQEDVPNSSGRPGSNHAVGGHKSSAKSRNDQFADVIDIRVAGSTCYLWRVLFLRSKGGTS
jgi:hypothetical protein